MFFVRPSIAIQRGGTSSVTNDPIAEAGAGPVAPHAQPFGPVAAPHDHLAHFTLLHTRHQYRRPSSRFAHGTS